MPFADNTLMDAEIADVLNAAAVWAGAITAGIRSPAEIENARQQACLEVLRAISMNPEEGHFGTLQTLVPVAHNSGLPEHDGEIGQPRIIPFEGATAREGRPAAPDEIDSWRLNPESYTGAIDGIVIPHDQPNANRVEGALLTVVLRNGGTGYAVGDTGVVDSGDGNGTYEILSVAGGAVLGFLIINRGSAYNIADNITTHTAGIQPGAGIDFIVDIQAIGSDGVGKQSPLSCYFSIVASRFKFTGHSAEIPMMNITETMRDTQIPLAHAPAVVKRAIPKLVKPGDALYLIAGAFAQDGKQDLVEIQGGAMSVRAVRSVPDIVSNLKL